MQQCGNIFRHTLQERNKNKKAKLHSGAAGDGCLFDEACECGNQWKQLQFRLCVAGLHYITNLSKL